MILYYSSSLPPWNWKTQMPTVTLLSNWADHWYPSSHFIAHGFVKNSVPAEILFEHTLSKNGYQRLSDFISSFQLGRIILLLCVFVSLKENCRKYFKSLFHVLGVNLSPHKWNSCSFYCGPHSLVSHDPAVQC